jgi:hypothetical protein
MSDFVGTAVTYLGLAVAALLVVVLTARLVFRLYFQEKREYLRKSLKLAEVPDDNDDKEIT